MRWSIVLTFLGTGLLGADLIAQPKTAPKALPQTPLYGLEISTEEPVTAQLPSQMYETGFQCTSDGSVVVNSVPPLDQSNRRGPWILNTISPSGKVVSFDFKKISDVGLRDGQDAMAQDVGDHDVDFLFDQLGGSKHDGRPQDGRPAEATKWFVVRFDRDGMYHGATELNLPGLVAERMAVFDDGDLLIFALDETNRQPQLIRYSMVGQKVHYYFADVDFARKDPTARLLVDKGTNPDKDREELFQLDASVRLSQLSHYKDSIVLLQKDEGTPSLQAFPDGSVRTIKLPKVAGFSRSTLIPSDDQIYVEYRNEKEQAVILELNPNTGDELRRIVPGDLEVACVHQGAFRVIRHSGEHTFQFFNARVRAAADQGPQDAGK
jgi:hypothetical protein